MSPSQQEIVTFLGTVLGRGFLVVWGMFLKHKARLIPWKTPQPANKVHGMKRNVVSHESLLQLR